MCNFLSCNHHTCDVITNEKIIKSMQKCNWALRLQTRTGKCVVNQVGELMDAGNAWHYPQGVAKIVSRLGMIVHRKWRFYYSADECHRIRDIKTLGFDVIAPQGFE